MICAKRSLAHENYQLDILYVAESGKKTEYYPSLCVVRRGTTITFCFKTWNYEIDLNTIGLEIVTRAKDQLEKIEVTPEKSYKNYFTCHRYIINIDTCFIVLKTTNSAPVGLFEVSISQDGNSVTASLPIFIVFNPHNSSDDVYCDDISFIDDYLYHQRAKTHYGDVNYYSNQKYRLDQFSLECLSVSDIYLSRMNLIERTSPIMVSRKITAFVNSNDDHGLIDMNWEKNTSGTSPIYWKNLKDIYVEYIKEQKPVKCGLSFVCAALVASLCRSIGIVCRIVTGFALGHNYGVSGILKVYISKETLKTVTTIGKLWNFHCWNNVWLKQSDILTTEMDSDSRAEGWQHIDYTPQERSQGSFSIGPFPISFMKSHTVKKIIPYDGFSAYQSINVSINYIIADKENKIVKETPMYIKKLLLTSNRFRSDIDITSEYVDMESRPEPFDPFKFQAEITVEESVPLGKPLTFDVKIENTSDLSPTVMCVSLQLRNQFGRNILTENMEKSLVFTEKDIKIKGKFNVRLNEIAFDVTFYSFYWELRVYDHKADDLKIIQKNTALKPLFKGTVYTSTEDSYSRTCQLFATIKNETSLKLEDTKISVQYFNMDITLKEETVVFEPDEEKIFKFILTSVPEARNKIVVYSIYGACYQKIGSFKDLADE